MKIPLFDKVFAVVTLVVIGWMVGERVVEYAVGIIVGGIMAYLVFGKGET